MLQKIMKDLKELNLGELRDRLTAVEKERQADREYSEGNFHGLFKWKEVAEKQIEHLMNN